MNLIQETRDLLSSKGVELNGSIDYLFDIGLITERQALRVLIKSEYFARLKDRKPDESCFHIKIDVAEMFNVSVSLVNKVLYQYKEIKI